MCEPLAANSSYGSDRRLPLIILYGKRLTSDPVSTRYFVLVLWSVRIDGVILGCFHWPSSMIARLVSLEFTRLCASAGFRAESSMVVANTLFVRRLASSSTSGVASVPSFISTKLLGQSRHLFCQRCHLFRECLHLCCPRILLFLRRLRTFGSQNHGTAAHFVDPVHLLRDVLQVIAFSCR